MLPIFLWYWGRRGAVARYTLELAQALHATGDVTLTVSLSRHNDMLDEFRAIGARLHLVDTYTSIPSFLGATLRLPALRRELRRQVQAAGAGTTVISTTSHPWAPLLVSALPPAARLISVVHDAQTHPGDINPLLGLRLRRELARAQGVVALSGAVRDQLLIQGHDGAPIRVIPLGTLRYGIEAPPPRVFPGDRPFRFLFFGRIQTYKGVPMLLRAFQDLRCRHADIELRIAGAGDPGVPLGELANMPGVTLINRWIGEEEVPGLLADADAVVLPYLEASQSGVVATAFAMDLPCVVTPIGGLLEQVEDGRDGTVADGIDAAGFARAMARLLDPAVYERCVSGARETAGSRLSWGAIARDFLDFSREVAPDPAGMGRRP